MQASGKFILGTIFMFFILNLNSYVLCIKIVLIENLLLVTKTKEDTTMAHVINDGCLMCGACAGACPVGAISEGDGTYVIDADACIDCGACEAGCPAGVIAAE